MTDNEYLDKASIAAMQGMIAGKYEDVLITIETAMKAWQFAQAMAVERERHRKPELLPPTHDNISMRGDHDSC